MMDEKKKTQTIQKISERLQLFPNLEETLDKLGDDAIEAFAEDAMDQALEDGFTEANVVRGASFLAAHFCTVASNTNSNISKQQASVLTIEYFDRGGSDDYLAEYKRLKNSLGKNTITFL